MDVKKYNSAVLLMIQWDYCGCIECYSNRLFKRFVLNCYILGVWFCIGLFCMYSWIRMLMQNVLSVCVLFFSKILHWHLRRKKYGVWFMVMLNSYKSYIIIENCVRNLKALGVPTHTYGSFLVPILNKRIPEELWDNIL